MRAAKIRTRHGHVFPAAQPPVRTDVEAIRLQLDNDWWILRPEVLDDRRAHSTHEDSLAEPVGPSHGREHYGSATISLVNVAALLSARHAPRRVSQYLTAKPTVSVALPSVRQARLHARLVRIVQPGAVRLLSTLLVDATAAPRHRSPSITINTINFPRMLIHTTVILKTWLKREIIEEVKINWRQFATNCVTLYSKVPITYLYAGLQCDGPRAKTVRKWTQNNRAGSLRKPLVDYWTVFCFVLNNYLSEVETMCK